MTAAPALPDGPERTQLALRLRDGHLSHGGRVHHVRPALGTGSGEAAAGRGGSWIWEGDDVHFGAF